MNDFEYTRRFFCRAMPTELDDGDNPTLIVQSYYVHEGGYALRVRLKTRSVRLDMSRYEASRDIDARIAGELIRRGGEVTIKNRFSDWIDEDGWNIDVFGGANAPLIIAEAQRIGPVTNLVIPKFCTTEITDPPRFSNEGLAAKPYSLWQSEFERELEAQGPRFLELFGKNRME